MLAKQTPITGPRARPLGYAGKHLVSSSVSINARAYLSNVASRTLGRYRKYVRMHGST